MSKKLIIKKRKKDAPVRPFNDEDTVIQWREDFVQDYVKEPLLRKANEESIVERVFTEQMEKDVIAGDENDTVNVRTRGKQLPAMPVEAKFMDGMKNSVHSPMFLDIRDNLRCYNDAIRDQNTAELGKIFLLGMIRQLRYWSKSQQPQPFVAEGETGVDWILTELLPNISQDMSKLSTHFSPEIDKVYFRRWQLEMAILQKELQIRKKRTDDARAKMEELGIHDPTDSTPEDLEETETDVEEDLIGTLLDNPEHTKKALQDPKTRARLIEAAWSQIYNHDGNIEYLNLLQDLKHRNNLNSQETDNVLLLLENMQTSNVDDIEKMCQEGKFGHLLQEIQLASYVLRNTYALEILQQLLRKFGLDVLTEIIDTEEGQNFLAETIVTEAEKPKKTKKKTTTTTTEPPPEDTPKKKSTKAKKSTSDTTDSPTKPPKSKK